MRRRQTDTSGSSPKAEASSRNSLAGVLPASTDDQVSSTSE